MLYLDSSNCLFIHTLSKKPSELVKPGEKGVVSCSELLISMTRIAHRQSFIAVANLIALTVSQKRVLLKQYQIR